MVGLTVFEAWQSVTKSLNLPYMIREFYPLRFVPPSNTAHSKSVVGVNPDDSGVMIKCTVISLKFNNT